MSDVQVIERVITVPADHPCLPGHFPARPIVPAVVILDEVRAIMASARSDQQPIAIDHCKFQDFVLPDQPFRIIVTTGADATADFTCLSARDDRLLAKGRVRFEPVDMA